MVHPYRLEEVLETLQMNRVIDDFSIGTHLVKIVPPKNKRFDLAMYFCETTLKPPDVYDGDPLLGDPSGPLRKARRG